MTRRTGMDEQDFEEEPKRKRQFHDPNQESLFGVPPRARNSDPDTSHEAAKSMHVSAASRRGQILEWLRNNPEGGTADAIEEVFGWRHAAASRRLPELRELGLAKMTEDTAATRSGRRARIWRII